MSKESIVLLLGIALFLTPHLGVPEQWKFYVYVGSGLILIFVGYGLRRAAYLRSIENAEGEHDGSSFTESDGSVQRQKINEA